MRLRCYTGQSVALKNRSDDIPELMAPAGDWDALRAATANGADAVYFGLDNFNARYRAANFSVEELPEIMQYLRDHNVKGFLTFNTLIFSDELSDAVKYIERIAAAGVDAVIVQDMGLARLIREMAPALPIHGSTQMTLTEPRGIELVRRLGIERVVLARELSISEIREIAGGTSMDLEVFAHGALCVAYSGQCLTSESLGGRSANRGQCAQACRLPYDLIVDGQQRDMGERSYLLSPQDLAAYELVGELAGLGIACLKIEGRLKSAHYVAAATQTYRQALDAVKMRRPFRIDPRQRADLEQTFSRGFTHGFLDGVNHQALVAARFPKSRGVRIGQVVRVLDRSVLIELERGLDLKAGDGVVFDEGHPEQDEQGGRIFAVRARPRRQAEIELGRGDVNLAAISVGAIVWKTDDPALRRQLEHSFSRDTVVNRVPLKVQVHAQVGQKLTIVFDDGQHSASVQWDKPLEAARKFPLSEQVAREQLGRLGDTPYELKELTLDCGGGPMAPKSVLNDLRRRAVQQLLGARSGQHAIAKPQALEELRDAAGNGADVLAGKAALSVLARTLDQVEAVLSWKSELRLEMVWCDFENARGYREAVARVREAGIAVGLATLRIVKPHEYGMLRQILDCGPDAVLVRNLGALSFYQEFAPEVDRIGDYSLNIANELTAGIFAEAGLKRMVPSYDLNWRQLAAMLARFDPGRFECVVHQHMPMFHMEHCVFAHTLSTGKDYRDCGRPCEQHRVDLRDRVGQSHPLIPDVGCRNTVFNGQAQSAAQYIPEMLRLGIRHFRVELLREDSEQVAPLLDHYSAGLLGRSVPRRALRVLNQLGVTRGTLDRE